MKRFIPAITLITLLGLEAPIHATWNAKRKPRERQKKEEASMNTPGFNHTDNRAWFVEADYLFWRPQMEDCFFTLKNSVNGTQTKSKIQQPSFDLSSGVRAGIGKYTHDSWDIGLRGTYLHSNATKHVHAHTDQQQQLFPQWFGIRFGQTGLKAAAHWKMNFYLLDFSIGREYFLTKKFAVHPFIGLRGAVIDQKIRCNYSSIFLQGSDTAPTQVVLPTQFKGKNNLWGVGPRVGLDLNYYFCRDWSFLGGFAGSLLYTRYHVDQKANGFSSQDTSTIITVSANDLRLKDRTTLGRANVDAYFGLGWDHWYNQNKNRVAVALVFEGSQWFGINQWMTMDLTQLPNGAAPSIVSLQAIKNHGDLSLIGGTVHFQLDF